jgi:hypothetical protein
MTDVQIRPARLDDTQAISALFRAQVGVWQRINVQGQVEDLPYEALTVYERWLHGSGHRSPWMSVETAAIFLSHLILGAGLPLVAELEGEVIGYAEAYPGMEPEPFGSHLHIGHLVIQPEHAETKPDDSLMRYVLEKAPLQLDCRRVLVSISGYDSESAAFYQQYGMQPLAKVQRYSIAAKTGQSFYRAVEHSNTDLAQIDGWGMTVGRLQSARHQWVMLWSRLWDAVPEIAQQRIHRLQFSATGHEAFLCCQEQLYNPRSADIYCWSPKQLTPQQLVAIRDWAHREGYRTLVMAVNEDAAKVLGDEAEPDPYFQQVYSIDVS